VINPELQETEQKGLCLLAECHKGLFNVSKGCVREPPERWLRIPILPKVVRTIRPRPPYHLSPANEKIADREFDDNHASGWIEECHGSPYGLQVFVIVKNGKTRPVVDMWPLNAGDGRCIPLAMARMHHGSHSWKRLP
jgi:hypothetical protein